MFEEYLQHNLYWRSLETFLEQDPQLANLKNLKFVHPLDWWKGIDWSHPGIFLLTGGRQLGKTTSTKLLIRDSLKSKKFSPKNIFYLPCDQIENHQELGRMLRLFLEKAESPFLLIVDEVTYVREWDRAIKALADEGRFKNGFCIITGSDSVILKDAMARFPGRRGEASKTDFHLSPLDFREYLELTDPSLLSSMDVGPLFAAFDSYLKCGGHLRAINSLHQQGAVSEATFATFEQWIRGDFEKRGKNVNQLCLILKSIVETLGSQVTYSSLTSRVGEISKPTFIDYCGLLERLDILFDLQAFDQNKKIGFPRKARKFHFWDPFILETVLRWLKRELFVPEGIDPTPAKAEAAVAAAFKKKFPAYYHKGKGEIDVVALVNRKPVFIEVKWTSQVRPWDLGELKIRKPSFILTKNPSEGMIDGVQAIPLPFFLARMENFI
ncbi:MAG: ATP-binding protein [bacterium]|nr:ATP-binding protein [bacterium]